MTAPFKAHSSGLRRAVANFGWLTGQFVLRLVVSVVAAGLTARYLGPDLFGEYAFALAVVMLFGDIASLGVQGIVTRDLVEEPQSEVEILSSAAAVRYAGGLVCWVGALAVATVSTGGGAVVLGVLIVGAGLLARPLAVADHLFEAQVDGRPVAVAQVVGAATLLSGTIVAVGADLGLAGIFAARLLDILATSACMWWLGRRRGVLIRLRRARWTIASSHLREGFPIAIAIVGATLNNRIDQIMLGIMRPGELGVYAAAVRISEIWYVVPGFVVASVFPRLVTARASNRKAFDGAVFELARLLTWLGIAIAAITFVLSPWIIRLIYGPQFNEAADVLRVHVWAGVFMFNRATVSRWQIIERLTRYALIASILGAVVNVILNLVLIPRYGAVGAAWSTVVSYGIAGLLALWVVGATRPLARLLTLSFRSPPRWSSFNAIRAALRANTSNVESDK